MISSLKLSIDIRLNCKRFILWAFTLFFAANITAGTKKDRIPYDKQARLFVNHAPVFINSSYFYTISEDLALGSSPGAVSATDADGDLLTYTIKAGNTNGTFSINPSSGVIKLGKRLNHHTQDGYLLTIKVNDSAGLSSETAVIISVQQSANKPGIDSIPWSKAANQPYTVNESQGEVVNGQLYTFGGFDSQKPSFTPTDRAYVYNPVSNKWTSIAAMPPMNGTNYGGVTHAGFTTDGTDIYFAGGYTSNANGTGQKFGTKEVWKYIVAENRYVRLPDLPIVIAAGQLEYLAGKLHHIGGTNAARTMDLGNHYVLNLDSLSAGWKTLAPLPNPRQHSGSTVFEDKIYYIGGQHGQDDNLVTQKDMHCYIPATNTWIKLADLPVPDGANGLSHISSATIVVGKYIVVMAGETVHNTGRTNLVSAYNPALNVWRSITPLPQTRYSGVAANLSGSIYYTGGSKTSITYKGKGVNPVNEVESLTLFNADTDQPLKMLLNMDTIDLGSLTTKNINIVANTTPAVTGSVLFNLAGQQDYIIIENKAPYALFGDINNTDYKPWTPFVGSYTLKSSPYTLSGAKGSAGYSPILSFTVINKATENLTLLPIADAFVRNGAYANSNYGFDSLLNIKNSHSSEYARYAYLKFALNSINDSNITSAILRIYGRNITNKQSTGLSCYRVNDDAWLENGITFNNAPVSLFSPLSTVNISDTAEYYEFDVTTFIKNQVNSDKIASFLLKDPKTSEVNFVFNSRENSQNPPQLFVEKTKKLKTTSITKISSQADNPMIAYELGRTTIPSKSIGAKLYPNPAHSVFNLELPKAAGVAYNLQIIDLAGKTYDLGSIQLKPAGNISQINFANLGLRPGAYFVRIGTANGQAQVLTLTVQ